jgi:ketosteroid isomerase-like protein
MPYAAGDPVALKPKTAFVERGRFLPPIRFLDARLSEMPAGHTSSTKTKTSGSENMSVGDHDDIRVLLDDWAQALRNKDANAIIAYQSPNIRAFSLAAPLETIGDDRAGLQAWLDTWEGGLEFEIRNTDLRVGGDIAWCSALARLAGRKIGTGESGLWFRLTVTFAREDGRWKIAHTHESVPFAMEGQPLALLDLKP